MTIWLERELTDADVEQIAHRITNGLSSVDPAIVLQLRNPRGPDEQAKGADTRFLIWAIVKRALAGGPAVELSSAACYDCGRPYGDEYGFPDLVVPHDVWARISPKGNEGGLLCPSCMAKRCHQERIECTALWTSGPFVPRYCEDCDAPATEKSADNVDLCAECYAELCLQYDELSDKS